MFLLLLLFLLPVSADAAPTTAKFIFEDVYVCGDASFATFLDIEIL